MLKNINLIRFYKRIPVETGVYGQRIFRDILMFESSNYISAIFNCRFQEAGDFELVMPYDQIARNGIIATVQAGYDIILELMGPATGDQTEQRVFKVKKVEIENDTSNNITVRLTGVGMLGIYENIPVGRFKTVSTLESSGEGTYIPETLFLKSVEYDSTIMLYPLKHAHNIMIAPLSGQVDIRTTTTGTEALWAQDLGIIVKPDFSIGTHSYIGASALETPVQASALEYLSSWFNTYELGVIGSEMVNGNNYPVDSNSTKYKWLVPLVTIAKKQFYTRLFFRDSDGSFKLNKISFNRDLQADSPPLMQGQNLKIETPAATLEYEGQTINGLYNDGVNTPSIGGNVKVAGVSGFYIPYDIAKPRLVDSKYRLSAYDGSSGQDEAIAEYLRIRSKNASSENINNVTFEGTLNLDNFPDIHLGDVVNISVLNDTYSKNVTIKGLTYICEAGGFKVEAEYE